MPACAADGVKDDGAGVFSVLFENDVFFGTDRDYTNGVLFTYTQSPQQTPDWAKRAARLLPLFPQSGDAYSTYELGQNIYTPQDLKFTNPPLTERPYAGFLYAGIGLVVQNPGQLDQLQGQLGVVGPASLAEQTQKLVHKLFGFQTPEGWGTQLHNEPALELTYEHSWRGWRSGTLLGFSFDVDPHAGGAVGNVYDYVNAGAMARLGFDLPDDYGPLRIDPSLPGSSFFPPPKRDFAWYVFAGFDGRAIGHDIFLDGNSFATSRSVAKNVFVGDLDTGVELAIHAVRITFTHVIRSKQYKTQPGIDQFGAINVSFRF